ncbi:MAG: type II toxin-antitoxin system Phd/YefM family antitoxin [Elusimicrobia bacterium]|nr:type II toxin-antitoxin system Phd/YefM family antitoxin [Elusimicrobiota bacterium]
MKASRKHGFGHKFKTAWQLQEAKARFSELFRIVRSDGVQWVTRQGKEAVVLLPSEQFDQLVKRQLGPQNLVEFFAKSPLAGIHLEFKRQRDTGRTINL